MKAHRRNHGAIHDISQIAQKRWLTLQEAMIWTSCRSRNTMKKRLDEGWYDYDQLNNGRGDYLIDRESIDAKHGNIASHALAILKTI